MKKQIVVKYQFRLNGQNHRAHTIISGRHTKAAVEIFKRRHSNVIVIAAEEITTGL